MVTFAAYIVDSSPPNLVNLQLNQFSDDLKPDGREQLVKGESVES